MCWQQPQYYWPFPSVALCAALCPPAPGRHSSLQAGLCVLLHMLGACSHFSDCAAMQAGAKGKEHRQQICCCTRLCLYSGGVLLHAAAAAGAATLAAGASVSRSFVEASQPL